MAVLVVAGCVAVAGWFGVAAAASATGATASAGKPGAAVRVSGEVALQRGDLAQGYEVRLVPVDGSEVRSAFVSTNGKYRFDAVAPGTYRLRVVRSGTTYQGPGPKVAIDGRRERIDLYVLTSGRTLLSSRRSR